MEVSTSWQIKIHRFESVKDTGSNSKQFHYKLHIAYCKIYSVSL